MLVKPANVFGMPVELDDNWIVEHKDHSLCWMNHTVFDKKKKTGARFRECICYTCRKVARQLLTEVGIVPAPASAAPKKLKPLLAPVKKKKRLHNFFF